MMLVSIFNAPPRTGSDRVLGDATVEHIALNWKKGAKTITIPENGSVTVRVLGREGGAFVEKVMLLSMNQTRRQRRQRQRRALHSKTRSLRPRAATCWLL